MAGRRLQVNWSPIQRLNPRRDCRPIFGCITFADPWPQDEKSAGKHPELSSDIRPLPAALKGINKVAWQLDRRPWASNYWGKAQSQHTPNHVSYYDIAQLCPSLPKSWLGIRLHNFTIIHDHFLNNRITRF